MKNFKNLNPSDYLQILWRRKWYFLVTFVLVVAGVTVYAYRQPQFFRSETRILVKSAAIPEDYVRPVIRASPQDRINAISAQVQSRTFLARIIEQYQLYGFGSGSDFRPEEAVGALRASIRIDVSTSNTFTLSYYSTDPQQARDITKRLADSLIQANVAASKNATIETDQFIDEQLRRAERDLVAQEDKIREYKIAHLGALPEQGSANLNILTGLQTQLASVEGAIERIKEQQKMLDLSNRESALLGMAGGSASDSLLWSVPQTESASGAAAPAGPASALEQQLALRRAQLEQLALRLRPGHPDYNALEIQVKDLEKKLADLNTTKKAPPESSAAPLTSLGAPAGAGAIATTAQPTTDAISAGADVATLGYRLETEGLKNELAKRERDRGEIIKQIKMAQAKLNLAPAIEQELMTLARDHEVLQDRYGNLQGKKFSSQMAASVATDVNNESYSIIDEANLPEKPAFPDRKQMILMGLGAALFLGLAVVAGREYLDPTLGSEHEAATALNLPVLISIPEIPVRARARRRLLMRKAS